MKRPHADAPLKLDSDTSEEVLLSLLKPELEQLSSLTNRASNLWTSNSKDGKVDAEKRDAHSRNLVRCVSFCVRMSLDYQAFAANDTYLYRPLSESSQIVPSFTFPYCVLVMACGGEPLKNVDRCSVSFCSPISGREDVTVFAQHLIGNLFCFPVPNLPYLTENKERVEVILSCEGKSFRQMVEVCATPVMPVTSAEEYSETHLPLHFAALKGDVPLAISLLAEMDPKDVEITDDSGVGAAALTLFFGKRVLFSLMLWKKLGWPMMAAAQMLRCRMELDCSSIDHASFVKVKKSVQDFVYNHGPSVKYRPVPYETVPRDAQTSPLAVMLLTEIPFLEHMGDKTIKKTPSGRRGSLDMLLVAIQELEANKVI